MIVSMKAQLDLIGIVVEDMGRALAFYRELGLDVPEDGDGQPHVEATLPGGLRLAWDTRETIQSFNADWQPASGGPQIGLAFRVDSPADVDTTYERLVSLGYDGHKAPFDAPWGQRYALVRDPDGNSVDLFAPL
jgi:catechol 2,3-dioxygenase-like lactoylglutathione lyase family enzyme